LVTNCHADFNKYMANMALYKLNFLNTGAYAINKKLFPCCIFFQNEQDIDLIINLFF